MSADRMSEARRELKRVFGYPDFRGGQSQVIAAVLAGRDVLAVLPTGAGKSLCYQIPALLLPGLTVVVSPLISLMQDQVGALINRGLKAAFINSTISASQVSDRMARVATGEIRLLYVAPERFDGDAFARLFAHVPVALLAIDEAHCISEWGHDFRPSYTRIVRLRQQLHDPQCIALTATATPAVRREIIAHVQLRTPAVVVSGFDRPNLRYEVSRARNEADKLKQMATAIRPVAASSIVYCSTRRAVERIAANLRKEKIRAEAYHAGLPERRRAEVQESFMLGRSPVIVATNAFGMGIDKPDVRLVVHHSIPGTLESYYQEAGRAGRDGKNSHCLLLYNYADRNVHEHFIRSRAPESTALYPLLDLITELAAGDGYLCVDDLRRGAAKMAGQAAGDVKRCIAFLERQRVLLTETGNPFLMRIRFLAAPSRIKSELGRAGREMELQMLRDIWRAAGGALNGGAAVDLQCLQPGLGDISTAGNTLNNLQKLQFITVDPARKGWMISAERLSGLRGEYDRGVWERRRAGDLGRLDAVMRYAATGGCRRAVLLRYFGETPQQINCGFCDNCRTRKTGRLRPRGAH